MKDIHSPLPTASQLSPKEKYIPHPNLNPFSPLSPDLPENQLLDDELAQGDESNEPRKGRKYGTTARGGTVTYYSRRRLLEIAKSCQQQGWMRPQGMGGLETWFGPISPNRPFHVHQGIDDPAIASIGPPAGGSRRGGSNGFGEGFGYGGGIGGMRGLGRGGRNVGLRRLPDSALDALGLPVPPEHRRDAHSGQMGKFSMKAPGERGMRLGGDEPLKGPQDRRSRKDNGEWRRNEKMSMPPSIRPSDQQRRPREGWNNRYVNYEDEVSEPAWMNDATTPSASTNYAEETNATDPLIHLVSGEDMIAAHKKAMKAREPASSGQEYHKPMVAFFGAEQSISPSPASQEPSIQQEKAKVFNAANYLRPSKTQLEDGENSTSDETNSNAFQSRFQRFFATPSTSVFESSSTSSSQLQRGPVPAENSTRTPSVSQDTRSISTFESNSGESTSEPPPKVDHHMARLMGLLSAKTPSTNIRMSPNEKEESHYDTERPGLSPTVPFGDLRYRQQSNLLPRTHLPDLAQHDYSLQPISSAANDRSRQAHAYMPAIQQPSAHGLGPPPGHGSYAPYRFYAPPETLVRTQTHGMYDMPSGPPDALQLLAQAQSQHQHSISPVYPPSPLDQSSRTGRPHHYRETPHSPLNLLREQDSNPSAALMHMDLRGGPVTPIPSTGLHSSTAHGYQPPSFPFQTQARLPASPAMGFGPPASRLGDPVFAAGPSRPDRGDQRQQNILATLFAGLGSGAGEAN